jgi:Tfp pilus assembly PilM family ATPase/Tfp pilus assembly protein PilN
MHGFRTALGIDVSGGRINLALLKKHGDSVKLLKAAGCPVPDGAIRDGNIENAAVLAGAIKKLKAKNGIRVHPTAISLIANPTLMQILDLPKDATGNVRQFVFNEVKHYAMLPIKKAAMDFCGIKSAVKSGCRRALVVAIDGQKVTVAMKTMNRRGLNIEVIEPAWIAYTRACYVEQIAGKTDMNLLFAMIFDGVLTLSVFRDNTLDFIRVKHVEPGQSQSDDHLEWVEEEINEVLKFYEIRASRKKNKWQAILVTDIEDEFLEAKAESLRSRLDNIDLQIKTAQHAYLDTPIASGLSAGKHSRGNCESKNGSGNKPSAVAVGLAMGLLNTPDAGLNINLLPSAVAIAKSREKKILVLSNIAATFLVLMILSTAFINAGMEKAGVEIKRQKQLQASVDTQTLLNEQSLLQKQIADVSAKLEQINNTIDTNTVLDWGPILNEIGDATPETVRISKLDSGENSEIQLSGQAVSYPAVNLFIEALNKCRNIDSASLIGSRSDRQSEGLVEYSIRCTLIQ